MPQPGEPGTVSKPPTILHNSSRQLSVISDLSILVEAHAEDVTLAATFPCRTMQIPCFKPSA